MSYEEASTAIQMLEGAPVSFDYESVLRYVALAKDFLHRSRTYCEANGLPLYSAFVESSSGFNSLPQELLDRLLAVAEVRQLSPKCIKACQEHIRFLFNQTQFPDSQREGANIYEPLFTLVVEGGDFYEHHGDICIRDAATVLTSKQ